MIKKHTRALTLRGVKARVEVYRLERGYRLLLALEGQRDRLPALFPIAGDLGPGLGDLAFIGCIDFLQCEGKLAVLPGHAFYRQVVGALIGAVELTGKRAVALLGNSYDKA